jgi:hypothetical protein
MRITTAGKISGDGGVDCSLIQTLGALLLPRPPPVTTHLPDRCAAELLLVVGGGGAFHGLLTTR